MAPIRQFRDSEILEMVECVGGTIPNVGKYLIVGLQSIQDGYNIFDDKYAVYDGHIFKQISTGTTNVGKTALQNFKKYNLPGAAVLKTDMFYKDCFTPGLHKGKMKALRANCPVYHYRDSDKDEFAEEKGELFFKNIWANMHGVSYDPYSNIIKQNINGWSFACQVWNNMSDYRQMIKATWKRNKTVDYALLKEW